MERGLIDLHIHSTASDGSFTPAEDVKMAVKLGLSAIALTDHDTVEGFKEAEEEAFRINSEAGREIIKVIPALELSTATDRDIHILGYFVDTENEGFVNRLKEIRDQRDIRNEEMCKRLREEGVEIELSELKKEFPGAIITRAHFAELIIKKGYVSDRKAVFQKYIGDNCSCHVKLKSLTPGEGIDIIRSTGGIAVLAHPLLYRMKLPEIDAFVGTLKEAGLCGIEAIYSNNRGYDEQNMRALAKKYDLLITGGSDFHGKNNKGVEMGHGKGNLKVPYEILDELIAFRS